MDKEQAIATLENMKYELSNQVASKYCRAKYEAIEMAIKALEQQKPIEKFENAKDHIFKLAGDYKCYDNRLTDEEALELCHILEQQTSEDCVSRQAVLDLATTIQTDDYSGNEIIDVVEVDDIKALPPVAPTRKVGKWVNKSHKSGCGILFVASECTYCRKKTLFNCDELLYNYCPNCGAEMRGDENDSIT